MSKITPFLWFEKDGREAAEFYVSVFKEDSKINHVNTMENTPSGKVEIVNLNLNGFEMTIMSAGPYRKINEAISFVIDCKDQEEVDYFWEKLSADPEAEQCGWIKDKYGVSWQVVPRQLNELLSKGNGEQSAKVTQAMLKMKKIIITDLQNAFDNK